MTADGISRPEPLKTDMTVRVYQRYQRRYRSWHSFWSKIWTMKLKPGSAFSPPNTGVAWRRRCERFCVRRSSRPRRRQVDSGRRLPLSSRVSDCGRVRKSLKCVGLPFSSETSTIADFGYQRRSELMRELPDQKVSLVRLLAAAGPPCAKRWIVSAPKNRGSNSRL